MKHWYALRSKPRQESTAELNLQRQGFTVYLPRLSVRKRQHSQWATVIEPLFPSYLFVHLDTSVENTAPVRSTRGVIGLVRLGQYLQPLPDALIAFLKSAEDPSIHARADEQWPHQPGDEVEILEGPLAGLKGVYQMQLAEERAVVLLELLGRYNAVQVRSHQIA